MILTITLNPLLERRLIFDQISAGEVNRTSLEEFKAGGKGINVSRQLNHLKVQNLAITFLGGSNGKILRRILTEEEINFSAVNTKEETRSACLAIEKNETRITSLFGPNPGLQKNEIDEIKSKIEKAVINSSIVVLSGSSPSKEANELFAQIIDLCHEHDKISVLDTYGGHLKSCIEKAPTIVHNNIEETEKSLGIKLDTEEEITKYLDYLYSCGVKLSFVTNGAEIGYASKFDFKYKFESPVVSPVDPTGSGDAFVAGLIYGMEESMIFSDFLTFAAAAGTANCTKWSVCGSSFGEIREYVPLIKISPVGKKMKIIDDSPNYQ